MDIQTLNSKQEKRLLKLFKRFFPEYYAPTLQPNGFINVMEDKNSSDYVDLIHWYQFCLTELPNKMLELYNNEYNIIGNLDADLCIENIHSEHPVNYLYKIYKEYKKDFYFF